MITEEELKENGFFYNVSCRWVKDLGNILVESDKNQVVLYKSRFNLIRLDGFDTIDKVNKLIAFLQS